MPRKAIPKIDATKVIEILDELDSDLANVVNAVGDDKPDQAIIQAVNASTHIKGIREGIALIVNSPTAANGGG